MRLRSASATSPPPADSPNEASILQVVDDVHDVGREQSGALGKIGVAYVDWSSEPFNRVIVDWRIIEDQASALAFAQSLPIGTYVAMNGLVY